MRPILALARVEMLHVVRDRATLAQVLVIPILQLLVLSNAATFEIRDTPVYVVDLDHTGTSRGLVSRFRASGHFFIVGQSASPDLADEALLDGRATLVLAIPPAFEESIVRTGRGAVQLTVNAEKGSAAAIVPSYAAEILSAYGAELGAVIGPGPGASPASGGGGPPPVRGVERLEVRTRGWYNPALDYRHYMVPGILVSLMTIIGTLLTAQNIAREKELGTLEQLNVTPITRGQFIAAKLLPFWLLGLFTFALGLLVGWLVFAIPIRGSLLLLFGAAAVYLVVVLGIGLFISTMVDTQQQAMFVTFFVLMIYLLLSGLFTPVESMAPWVQAVSQANPVRHFVAVSRAILVKGAGLEDVARPILLLAAYAAVTMTLAVRQYSKRAA
jgi:ABC-2 type transport system permease protein